MKKFLIVLFVLMSVVMVGCGTKEFSSATITRDEANTGGDLSFVYDSHDRCVYLGGEGEFLQFYNSDEAKGLAEGYRIGLKVIAPSEVKNFDDATLEINGTSYGDFLEKIENQNQNYFYIYPTFSDSSKEVDFKITWTQSSKPQKYKVILNEETQFLKT